MEGRGLVYNDNERLDADIFKRQFFFPLLIHFIKQIDIFYIFFKSRCQRRFGFS